MNLRLSQTVRWLVVAVVGLWAVRVDAQSFTIVDEFEISLIGDDVTESTPYDNTMFVPEQPMEVWFEGFAENLSTRPTNGVAIRLRADGLRVTEDVMLDLPVFDPMVGAVQVPFGLHATLEFSPAEISIGTESLGCCDDIHVAGTLTRVGVVPEPSSVGMAAIVSVICCLPIVRRVRLSHLRS